MNQTQQHWDKLERLSRRLKRRFAHKPAFGDLVVTTTDHIVPAGTVGVVIEFLSDGCQYSLDVGFGEASWFSADELTKIETTKGLAR